MRIPNVNDDFILDLGAVKFTFRVLTYEQKADVMCESAISEGSIQRQQYKTSMKILKHSLKSVEGMENWDGTPYEIRMKDDRVEDESISDIMNSPISSKMLNFAINIMAGVNDQLFDIVTGKELEGAKIIHPKSQPSKKSSD